MKILHFADLHLGVETYGRLDPATGRLSSEYAGLLVADQLAGTYSQQIRMRPVMQATLEALDLEGEMSPGQLAGLITVSPVGETQLIRISVEHTDPQMAADIANDISALVDSSMNRMKQKRAITAFKLVEREYFESQKRVRQITDSIIYYNKKGVISYDRQIERYTEAYGRAVAEGNFSAADRIDKLIKEFRQYTGPFLYFWEMRTNETLRLRDLTAKYIEAKAETELALSHIFILDKAYKAEKKSYPKKSIIVMVSTVGAFLMAVIAFLFFESFLKKIRTEE